MGERITDDFMADIETKLAAIENEYKPTCESVSYGSGCPGATDASVAFWRAAVDCIPAMLAEIRDRRAADLDLARLANVCHGYYQRHGAYPRDATESLLEALDKMLEARER
jgi:hypothetical protein